MKRREGFMAVAPKLGLRDYLCSRFRFRGSPSFPLLPVGFGPVGFGPVGFGPVGLRPVGLRPVGLRPEPAVSGTLILAPSRRRSTPSTTTLSPGASPSRTATRSPPLGPTLIGRTETVESALAT